MSLVFVYGTLMAEQVLARVVTGEKTIGNVNYSDATLKGYRRHRLEKRDYPGVVPSSDSSVRGKIVSGIDSNGLERLDYFEGDEYDRQKLPVTTAEGTLEAWVYVWKDHSLILPEEWEINDFVSKNLDKWVADELKDSNGMGGRFWKPS